MGQDKNITFMPLKFSQNISDPPATDLRYFGRTSANRNFPAGKLKYFNRDTQVLALTRAPSAILITLPNLQGHYLVKALQKQLLWRKVFFPFLFKPVNIGELKSYHSPLA